MTDLTPSAPPDREGWWYFGRPSKPQTIRPNHITATMVQNGTFSYTPEDFRWYGPVPTAQEWHEAKAELAMLWAMKEPCTLAEIDAAIARLQLAREEFL